MTLYTTTYDKTLLTCMMDTILGIIAHHEQEGFLILDIPFAT